MKHLLSIALAVILFVGCTKPPTSLPLTDWQFEHEGQWLSATVPGCIHTDLLDHDLIPDPFYGTNEDSVQWVASRDWHYRTFFLKRDLRCKFADVEFDGLQCYADIYLNGKLLLSTDNMFRQYVCSLPLDELLDTNTLDVIFHPTAPRDSAALAALGYAMPDPRVFSRTAPYQQGWDWGPVLNSCGLWQPVRIVTWNEADGQDRPCAESNPTEVRKGTWFDDHKISFEAKPDSIGLSYIFYDNGTPIFCKGANWIPCHSFPVLTPALMERYRTFLCSAKEANFNMIRIWGGGIYEHDYFFDLCDSLGLMVWMDFNFSCAVYPSDPAFLDNVTVEAEQQVRRIAKHPCVVLWCGNNEVKNGWEDWGWQKQYKWTPDQIAQIEHGIDTLFGAEGILAHAVKSCDPLQRPYVASSPLFGWGHPECVTHGDSHYWGVWWGELPFEVYKEKTGRFMSEYGFQSYPEWNTLLSYCPENQLNIDSAAMRSHQKHGRGLEIIDKAMLKYYGMSSRKLPLEDFVYVSQLLQAWGTGYGIFQHVKAQPYCMGTLYWQLNDCWPVASWSSIDCFGNWKALHYRAKELFADSVDLDKWERYYSEYPVRQIRLLDDAHYEIKSDPRHPLQLTVTAQNRIMGFYVATTTHIDGHFDVNFVDLEPGESVTFTFLPRDPSLDLSNVHVKVKTLNDLRRYVSAR